MKILAGLYRPDEGSIEVMGKPVGAINPREARDLGIGMIYQELNLVPDLTSTAFSSGRSTPTAICQA